LDGSGERQRVTREKTALDAIGDLAVAVLLSAAALEAVANECIAQLEDTVTIQLERRGEIQIIAKADMERRLSLKEKFHLIVPMLSGLPSIKGTKAWKALKRVTG
jgi:hypothetical protein